MTKRAKVAKTKTTVRASLKKLRVVATKPSTTSSHPVTSEMVNAAIGTLKDRKGSSFQAIKKYIGSNYIVNVERLSPFIKKYLKSAVEKNVLVQTTGTGASGRFKLAKVSTGKSSTKPMFGQKANKFSATKFSAAKTYIKFRASKKKQVNVAYDIKVFIEKKEKRQNACDENEISETKKKSLK